MKTLAEWIHTIATYVLAFSVSPWVAGVLLTSHITYEWLDWREHRKMIAQLQHFKQLNDVNMDKELMDDYLTQITTSLKKKDSGNC